MFFTSPPAVLQTVLPWLLDLAQWGRFRFWNLQFQPKLHEKGVQKGNYSNSTTQLIFLENHHFKKKKARTNQKFRAPGRNLSDFCWAIRMAWRLKPRRSGERREPVALLESIPRSTWTTWNPTTIPLSHNKNHPNHPRSQACGRLSRVTIDNLYFPPVGTQPKWPHPKAASEASHKV